MYCVRGGDTEVTASFRRGRSLAERRGSTVSTVCEGLWEHAKVAPHPGWRSWKRPAGDNPWAKALRYSKHRPRHENPTSWESCKEWQKWSRVCGAPWVAQSVNYPNLDFGSGCGLRVVRSSPASGSLLNGELAWDVVPLTLPRLTYACACTLSHK